MKGSDGGTWNDTNLESTKQLPLGQVATKKMRPSFLPQFFSFHVTTLLIYSLIIIYLSFSKFLLFITLIILSVYLFLFYFLIVLSEDTREMNDEGGGVIGIEDEISGNEKYVFWNSK